MKKTIAIIHYNTPMLTEACIRSIRKQGCDWQVVLFDNSDARPFTKKMKGVKRIDNTKGQVVNFDEFLAEYPDREPRYAMTSNFGSAKHIRTVQELWRLIPEGFVLLESDTLCRRDISELWREEFAVVGEIEQYQDGNKMNIPRLLPFICYINVPKLQKAGACYFDPQRCWALQKGEMTRGNWYDTGAALLEDVIQKKPDLVGQQISIDPYIYHYKGGSWHRGGDEEQKVWLELNKDLWQ